MFDQGVYRHFIDWLRQAWWDMPERGELMPLMMARYTPEEASLLTSMPFSGKSLEELAELKQMDRTELGKQLDALTKKGLVYRFIKGDTARYRLNDGFFILRTAGWHGRTDDVTKTISPLINQYYYHGLFNQYDYTPIKGLRALPIQGTIEDTRQILPYEEIAKVLDSVDYFTVSTCPCRHRKNIDPDSPNCQYPGPGGSIEVCLHFDKLGHYIVENGMGREITRQEAEDILRQCAEAGLVHGLSNWEEGPDTLCNCCRDCCIFLEAFHKLGHTEGHTPSNYRVRNNSETCIGCGLCVKRCPMEAMRLEDFSEARGRTTTVSDEENGTTKELKNKSGKVSVVNPDLCIGCGVCAYKCPTNSLVLERREVIKHPPKNEHEHVRLVMADFATYRAQRGQGETKS